MSSDKSVRQSLVSWIKDLGPWISIVSFVVSMLTSYFVYVDFGKLDLLFPPEVAVRLAPAETEPPILLIPMTFHFTGAPSRQEVITQANATVKLTPDDGSTSQTLFYTWRRTYRLIGKLEFERLYPERSSADAEDYIEYESRNVPFALKGHEVSFKLMEFEPETGTSLSLAPAHLEVCLEVSTIKKNFRACQAPYHLSATAIEDARATGLYQWISQGTGN